RQCVLCRRVVAPREPRTSTATGRLTGSASWVKPPGRPQATDRQACGGLTEVVVKTQVVRKRTESARIKTLTPKGAAVSQRTRGPCICMWLQDRSLKLKAQTLFLSIAASTSDEVPKQPKRSGPLNSIKLASDATADPTGSSLNERISDPSTGEDSCFDSLAARIWSP
ncbi:hypothetical protein PTTG_30284, partial [Puccinia triticina 1-1 BBBD Race 1]